MVYSVNHQPDLTAHEAIDALSWLSLFMQRSRYSDAFDREIIKLFSLVVRLGRIPIRRHEDAQLRSIYDCVRVTGYKPADYDSPYFKIFLLLQAHFLRLPLSPELAADLAVVLEHVFSVFSVCAHHDWSNSDASFVARRLQVLPLMRMCVHGMRGDDIELKQIPHFEDDVSYSIRRQGLRLIYASGHRPFLCSTHPVGA
jgi:pre-mRNA-splicing helicase BRR2